MNGGYASIRINLLEGRFLEVGHVHVLTLVWETKLFQNDGDLPWVGARSWRGISKEAQQRI